MKILAVIILLVLEFIPIVNAADTFTVLEIPNFPPIIQDVRLQTNNFFQSGNRFVVNNPLKVNLIVNVYDDNGYKDIAYVKFRIYDINDASNSILGDYYHYLDLQDHSSTTAEYFYSFNLLPEFKASSYILDIEVTDKYISTNTQLIFILEKPSQQVTGFAVLAPAFNFKEALSGILSLFYKKI